MLRHRRLLVLALAALASAGLAGAEPAGRWERDFRAFKAADAQTPPPRGAVLFLGASGIRRWETLERDLAPLPVIRRGFGGSRIAEATAALGRLAVPHAPRLIVLQSGNNDLNDGHSPEQVLADFRAFVAAARAALPSARVAFVSITTGPARFAQVEQVKAANALIRAEAGRDPRLAFIDIFPAMLDDAGRPRGELFIADGIHMNAEGYRVRAAIIRPAVQALFQMPDPL